MRLAWRLAVAGAVFVGVGFLTAKAVLAHAVAGGAMAAQVKLGAWMAGLFAGGIAGVLVGLALLLSGKRDS